MTYAIFDLCGKAARPSLQETAASAVFHTFRSKLASVRGFLQPFQIRANEHETPRRPRGRSGLSGPSRRRPMLIVVNAPSANNRARQQS